MYKSNWNNIVIPDSLKQIKGMISLKERALLYDITLNYFQNKGCVVDGGSFIGASTLCLGMGLKNKGIDKQVIHSYDKYVMTSGQHKKFITSPDDEGRDFLEEFQTNIKEISSLVKIYQGDLLEQMPPEEKIEILFVDIAKTPRLNDYIVESFFPLLIPNHSLIIHQDYLWSAWNGWVHCTMEYLSDYFEKIDNTPSGSVVFLYKKEIPREKLINTFKGRTKEEIITLHKQAISKFTEEEHIKILSQSQEHLLSIIDKPFLRLL
jgi:hypothetical protein